MSDNVYKSPYGNLYLSHGQYKYIKREWKNGKWQYEYPASKKDTYDNGGAYVKREWKNGKWNYTYNVGLSDGKGLREVSKKASRYASERYQKYKNTGDKTHYDTMNTLAKLSRSFNSSANKEAAELASTMRPIIKKWESTPISKLQTAYHKAADSVKKTLSKWKNALVSAFTPKETVKMITTDPSSGYRSVTTKKK